MKKAYNLAIVLGRVAITLSWLNIGWLNVILTFIDCYKPTHIFVKIKLFELNNLFNQIVYLANRMESLQNTRYILYAIFTVIATFFSIRTYSQPWIQKWDDRTMIDIAKSRTPEKTDIFMFLSRTNQYADIGVPAGLLVGGIVSNNKEMRENSLYVASSTAITLGVTMLIKSLVKRRRPFIQNLQIVPVYKATEFSFPSGHTSSSFALATSLSIAYPKWYVIAPAMLWAGSVSYSRMYLGVHYPTDVAAGAALGAGSAASMLFLKK